MALDLISQFKTFTLYGAKMVVVQLSELILLTGKKDTCYSCAGRFISAKQVNAMDSRMLLGCAWKCINMDIVHIDDYTYRFIFSKQLLSN